MRRAPYNQTKGQKNCSKLIRKLLNAKKADWTARQFAEKLFWGIVYLSALVLVLLSCNDFYNQYQQNPIAKTDSIVLNETITLPSLTVCLPFFEALEKRESFIYDDKNENETNEWKANQSTWTYVNNLDQFFGKKSWADIRNDDWPVPMLIVAQNYLSVVYETESLNGQSSKRSFQQLLEQQDNISLAITKSLIPKMKEWNVTIPEFRDEFSRKFQNIYPITVNCTNCYSVEMMTREMVFVNSIQVCFRLGFENFQFAMSSSIVMDIENIYVRCPDGSKTISNPKFCDVGFPPVTVDLTGQARAGSFYRDFDSIYTVSMYISSIIQTGLQQQFRSMAILSEGPSLQYISLPIVRGVAQCSTDETKEVCLGKCRNKIIQKRCNCSANTIPTQSQSSPLFGCLFHQFDNCMMNFTGTEDADCAEECLDFCISWKYDTSSSYSSFGLGQDQHYYVELLVSTTYYTVTTESVQWTAVTITGVLGGAAGFWLGLDIATIFYSIITVPLFLLSRKFSTFWNNQAPVINNNQEELNNNNNPAAVIESVPADIAISKRKLFDQSWDIKDPAFVIWSLKKLIWSVLFLAGAVLTILMFVQLIQQYQEGRIETNVNIIFNDTITIPDSALCLGAGMIPAFLSGVDPIINEIGYVQSELQIYLNQSNMNKETFLGTETWPPTLTFMAYVYLFALSAIIEKGTPPYVPFSDQDLVLNLTRSMLLKFSVSNEELQQKFAIEYMKLENMTIFCHSSAENVSVQILPAKATFETTENIKVLGDPLWLCLHLPLSSFEYRSTNDICSLTANIESDGYNQMYFIVKSSTSSYQDYYLPNFNFNIEEMANIALAYMTINQNFLNCNNTYTSFWDCWDNCRSETAARACTNCTISATSKTAAECPMDEYMSCLKTVPFATECTHECKLTSCSVASLAIVASSQAINSEIMAELNIRVNSFNYVLMSQEWAMTESDFFANCGGILGFWLGTDCTFFVGIVFTPLMLLAEALMKKIMKATVADLEETNMGRLLLSKVANIFRVDVILLPTLLIIKALFERIFWLVVYIVFGAFTLKMAINYHEQYFSTPIISTYDDVNDDNYKITPVTLCIPWVAPAPSNTTDEEVFEYIVGLPPIEMKQLIFNTNSTWPDSLLRISFQYLELMEGYKAMDQVNLSSLSGNTLESLNATRIIDIFDKSLEVLKITADELMQKFGQQMLQRDSVNVTKWIMQTNGSQNAKQIKMIETTFVSSAAVCFSPPPEMMSFASVADYFTIQSLLPYVNIKEYRDGIDFGYTVSVDLLGRQTGSPVDNFVLSCHYFTANTPHGITVEQVIRALPEVNGEKRCSDTTTMEVCMDACRVQAIEQQCNCTPASDRTYLTRYGFQNIAPSALFAGSDYNP